MEKIDAYRNGCMLYLKDYLEYCMFYGVSRYKPTGKRNPNYKKIPYAILRYRPLNPRLQKLYASKAIEEKMTWYGNQQTEEGSMCHSSDVETWSHFDRTNSDFTPQLRNVRLGLCTDGFAPHGMVERILVGSLYLHRTIFH
ncbi:UNVERIFIED_CONTAM: hypothetical protein Sradi_4423100 [Sesamum radiatum]|uniref:Uncharacterized protein n=1 Tax=Sesamum radiatum TaxID=300843 RepID=A0AAW2NRL3_SESRA